MTFPSPLTNRSVLVTGGTGSFGQAFVRHALDVGASRVAIVSHSEAKQADMKARLSDARLRFMVGDVRDRDRMVDACRGSELVVHAAALKRVEVGEADSIEFKRTNVDGSESVMRACIATNVSKAVLLSTDKAANPNTLYGTSKLMAERLWTLGNVYAAGTRTRFIATRYGNVLGSQGSVLPIWREQAKTGTLTVTSPSMTRFWITMAQAIELVEIALREGRGGEVFIPKIPSSTVGCLARAVAPDAEQRVVGIRRGEKIHETLIGEDESPTTYDCGDHYRIEPDRTWEYLPPLNFPKVPWGFSYRSDTNPYKLEEDEMRALIESA